MATAAFNDGKDANTNGDLYISNTVLFAIVLFFCGIYTRWDSIKIRTGILIITLVVFSFALYSLISPVESRIYLKSSVFLKSEPVFQDSCLFYLP